MKTLVLHGDFANLIPAEYNGRFTCVFDTAVEAFSAIEANFGNVWNRIRDKMLYVVPGNGDVSLDEEQTARYTIVADELHIYPVVEGAGGGKWLRAILGVALIAVAVVMTGGGALGALGSLATGGAGSLTGVAAIGAKMAFAFGVNLVLSALVQPPEAPGTPEDKPGLQSATYSGPINTQTEGQTLPYVAGREVIVGGVIVHTDLQIEVELTNEADDATISKISPSSLYYGQTNRTITITGDNLTGADTVYVGSISCAFTVVSDSKITFTAPNFVNPGSNITLSVSVVKDGVNTATKSQALSYVQKIG